MNPNLILPWLQQQSHTCEDPIPPRVRVALEYLRDCTVKTTQRAAAAPSAMSCEIIEGQKLTSTETQAQNAACDLLIGYFKAKDIVDGEGKYMACIACYPEHRQPNCAFCKGTGEILVTPSKKK